MATVETKTNTSSYIGMTGNNFKTRYYNHLKPFKNKCHRNETKLSKYLWKQKEKQVEHTITLEKLHQTCQRRCGLFNLCLKEKVEILLSQAKPSTQLNRRFEVSTCSHVNTTTSIAPTSEIINTGPNSPTHLSEDGGGGVDPIPCVSTHRISDPRSGPAQLLPPHVKQRSYPHGVRPQIPDR